VHGRGSVRVTGEPAGRFTVSVRARRPTSCSRGV
jgi:hypothetical protein